MGTSVETLSRVSAFNSAMKGDVREGSTPKPCNHPPGSTVLSRALSFWTRVSVVSYGRPKLLRFTHKPSVIAVRTMWT